MGQTLISVPLRNQRDAMITRQRARQLAGLLGFEVQEQASIAAKVFAAAWYVLHHGSPAKISFRLEEEALKIFLQLRRRTGTRGPAERGLILEKSLPGVSKVPIEDLAWSMEALDQITPSQIYEEIYLLNQELLDTLQALHACQAQLNQLGQAERTSAA